MPTYHNRIGPVLDYASPRPRGKVRLPSRSRIEMRVERDEVRIREWLEARSSAYFAIALAAVTLVLLPIVALQQFVHWHQVVLRSADDFIVPLILLAFWATELVVFLMVINNTWRRTFVEATRDAILLRFTSPFGERRYEWGASEIEEVRLENTTSELNLNTLGEVQIHAAAQPVATLFTDHSHEELVPIVEALTRALGLEDRARPRQR